MLIHELERETCLDRATIRYYEREGLISPQREENKYRQYSEENLKELLKIKLLRNLGMSVDRIRSLQQGTADFTDTLDEQIRELDKRAGSLLRAKEVCAEIKCAGVMYKNLDGAYYLRVLQRNAAAQEESHNLIEEIPVVHPWRRFLARQIDYTVLTLFINFILVVCIRLRPYGTESNLLQWIWNFFLYLLAMPVNAFLLSTWGTTVGKWLMGYRIEAYNVGKMYFSQAMLREAAILYHGMGLSIPIYSYWRLYKSYKEYKETGALEYDEEGIAVFDTKWNIMGIAARCIVIAAIIGGIWYVSQDMIKPKHLGELTVQEFAENYNDTAHTVLEEHNHILPIDSSGAFVETNSVMGEYSGYINDCADPFKPFEYVTEENVIREIKYSNTWCDILINEPLMGGRYLAAVTALLSQRSTGITDLKEFTELYNEMASSQEVESSFTYKNLEIRWLLYSENCISTGSPTWYAKDADKPSKQELEFSIIIH